MRTIFVFLLLMVVAVVVHAENASEDYRFDYELNPGGQILLKNVNGDVRIQGSSGNRVEIKATKRGRRENFDDVKIEINADSNRIEIRTEYPRYKKNTEVSVDYELRVPETAMLEEIETVNGDVRIESVFGRIDTTSVNGSIDVLNARSQVSSNTVNGSIEIRVASLSPNDSIRMESVNGSLNLFLPPSASANISGSTLNGSIECDFPLTVKGKFLGKRINGTIGSGGAQVDLETVNGRIRVTSAGQ